MPEWYPSFNPDPCSSCRRLVIVDEDGLCKRCFLALLIAELDPPRDGA